jgi:uncharacterized SAM-binding protein YcdF (DUF218 family)
MMKKFVVLVVIVVLLSATLHFARHLVIDQPQRADAILVLAGETDRRPARALELHAQGLAPLVIVDVPDGARIYNRTQLQIAQDWVNSRPERDAIRLCSTYGLSTRDESHDAMACLDQAGAHSVLLVTSDYHTRRALAIFRRELPSRTFSVAAARDPAQFGDNWWQHRQWAKVTLDEWLRLIWWKAVDQWR